MQFDGHCSWVFSLATFPWWPAVVVEEKDSSVPPSVKTQAKEFAASKEKAGVVHIVQFYDKTSSWLVAVYYCRSFPLLIGCNRQFLPLKTLRYLGEDKGVYWLCVLPREYCI